MISSYFKICPYWIWDVFVGMHLITKNIIINVILRKHSYCQFLHYSLLLKYMRNSNKVCLNAQMVQKPQTWKTPFHFGVIFETSLSNQILDYFKVENLQNRHDKTVKITIFRKIMTEISIRFLFEYTNM